LGGKKAPAGMGTPQHPGFKEKVTFLGEKKPLREWGHRSTLVLRKNTLFGRKKSPCGNGDTAAPWFQEKYQIISIPDY